MLMRTRPAAANSGFSIVELMIGITMVAVAFVGLAPLLITSNKVSETLSENDAARVAARAKLDELRAAPYESLRASFHEQVFTIDDDGDGISDLRPLDEKTPVAQVFVDSVPGGALDGEATRLSVVLRWESLQGPRSYRLHTIRARD